MSYFKERRAHRRAPVAIDADRDRNFCLTLSFGHGLNVLLEIDEQTDHNFYAGLTSDVSEGGVFVATGHTLPVGTRVTVSIQLPDAADPHQVEGIVRWIREPEVCRGGAVPGYGVQFDVLSAEALAAIREYVAHHETIFFEAA